MTDFLKLEKPDIDKGSIALENLKYLGKNHFGMVYYKIDIGFSPLKIRYNQVTGFLTIEGSIPFFWQGHNFSFSHIQFLEAIGLLSEILCTDLMESEVKCYEFGIVFPVELPPSYILQNHLALPGHGYNSHRTKRGEFSGIEYRNSIQKLKLYNLGLRIRQLLTKDFRSTIPGFDPTVQYMRLEKHVLRPDKNLQIRTLSLKDYCSDAIQERLKVDLMETYQAIKKKGTYRLSEGHKPPKGDELLLLMLADQIPDIRQAFDSKLKGLGLDSGTVKNRQGFIRNLLKKVEFIPDERIDLMPLIRESLD